MMMTGNWLTGLYHNYSQHLQVNRQQGSQHLQTDRQTDRRTATERLVLQARLYHFFFTSLRGGGGGGK